MKHRRRDVQDLQYTYWVHMCVGLKHHIKRLFASSFASITDTPFARDVAVGGAPGARARSGIIARIYVDSIRGARAIGMGATSVRATMAMPMARASRTTRRRLGIRAASTPSNAFDDVVRVCIDRVGRDCVVLRALDGSDRVVVARATTSEEVERARDVDAWTRGRRHARLANTPWSVVKRYIEYTHWMILNMVTFESMCCVIVDGRERRRARIEDKVEDDDDDDFEWRTIEDDIDDDVDDDDDDALCAIFAIVRRDDAAGKRTFEFTKLRRRFVFATLNAVAIACALGFPLYCKRDVIDTHALSAHHGMVPEVLASPDTARRETRTHMERLKHERYIARCAAMRRDVLAQRAVARALDPSRPIDCARAYDHVLHQRLTLAIALRREREHGLSVEDIELRNFHSHSVARRIDDCVYSGDRKCGFAIMALENAVLDEDWALAAQLRDTLREMNTASVVVRLNE